MNRPQLPFLLAATAFLCLAPALTAETRYRVVPLTSIGTAFAVNAAGDLAGIIWDERGNSHSGVLRGSVLVPIPALSPGGGRAYGLNDRGVVVGTSLTPLAPPYTGAVSHAYVWWDGGAPIDLTPGSHGASFANAVNNAGEIVGSQMKGDDSGAFLWRVDANGTVHEQRIGAPSSITNDAWDINEAGLVAGGHFDYAWVFDSKSGALDILPESVRGTAFGINDRNEVVGRNRHFGSATAARWRKSGDAWELVAVAALPEPHRICAAVDVNNSGVAIGVCDGPRGVASRAFVWTEEGISPLQDVLAAEDEGRWEITGALDINDRGTIVAAARDLTTGRAGQILLEPVNAIPQRRRAVRR